MHLLAAISAVVLGLAALVWSADRFVDGAAASARLLGVPPLLVGMVVVGFGTSAPELTVSALSAWQGSSAIALGNAWGSNICNIALILGLAAAIAPLSVQREALRFDLPALLAATALSWALVRDGGVSRANAWILLGVFAAWLAGSCLLALRSKRGAAAADAPGGGLSGRMAAFWALAGLAVLVASSRSGRPCRSWPRPSPPRARERTTWPSATSSAPTSSTRSPSSASPARSRTASANASRRGSARSSRTCPSRSAPTSAA